MSAVPLLRFPQHSESTQDSKPLSALLPAERPVEISGHFGESVTSSAVSLVTQAQAEGGLVAWVQLETGTLYPPDLHASGVDLESLLIIRIPTAEQGRASGRALLKATELLLRSGGFDLVITDLRDVRVPDHGRWQGRFTGLQRQHETRLVLLSHKPSNAGSLGPLIGLRIEPRREQSGEHYAIDHRVLKNKLGLTAPVARQLHLAPLGATEVAS